MSRVVIGFGVTAPAMMIKLSLANLVGLFALYLLGEFVGERHWLTTLIAYAPPVLFIPPTIYLLFVSLIRRNRAAIVVNLCAGIFGLFVFLGFHVPASVPPSAPTLRVMAYNIRHGDGGVGGVAGAVRQVQPDVISFEEINAIGGGRDPLLELVRALPDYHFRRGGDVALASRLPVRAVRVYPLTTGGAYRVALAGEIDCGGQIVTVVSVHLATAASAESLTHRQVSLPDYLRRTADVRAKQIAVLRAVLRPVQTPLIVCGDFNTPPRGVLYRRLTQDYTDAFDKRGWGFGWTFSSSLPVLRIDYIFTAWGAEPTAAFVPNTHASDHLPIVADIVVGLRA